MNIEALVNGLRDYEAALIISEENRKYFTGFDSSNGYLLITHRGNAFITDSRYIEDAKKNIPDCEVVLQQRPMVQIDGLLNKFRCTEVLIESSRLNVLQASEYKLALDAFDFNYTNRLDVLIASLREVKSSEEVGKIKEAQRIAEKAFEKTLHILKPGMLERDIANELDYTMRKFGADGISFDTIVVSGENSSKPHGVPGNRALALGDFVTFDFGAVYKGYHSDTTRTVALGPVTPEQAQVYDVVLRAQLAGVSQARPGARACDVDFASRNVIEIAGFGKCFGHGTGHGVGIEIHESPNVAPNSKNILQAGNIITVEPGIYIEGKFGVRIEDMLYLNQDGAENLVTLDKNLVVL